MFTAERIQKEKSGVDVTSDEIIQRISELEKNLKETFKAELSQMRSKLDIDAEENAGQSSVDQIMSEIQAMNVHIATTKQEVAALKPIDDANTTITTATDELNQVVISTEEAADAILNNAEVINSIVGKLRGKITEEDPDGLLPDIDQLEFISMELFLACSFQDVTGQRISKVVNSLAYIEERLMKMIDIWEIEHGTADLQKIALPKDDARESKELLHGPQNDQGMGQDAIDAMFD